ncbi:hypothetical protein EX30DRAFT_373834 [Ascodesmis nigricans]|uniref:Protein Zds1 C-terminal domain-containing protein n=1 Tax=Ascodesmis nigricans TaxID=341454 RepID=A0A4S2MS95_9PEZI|nr:hypothetical protein EX30DRAFT_373834 [Ascodesmis nigricans]
MQAASRARDSRGFSHSHGSRLSLNPEHHVTEAFTDMYEEFGNDAGNRYSFIASAPPDHQQISHARHPSNSKRFSGVPTLTVPGDSGNSGNGGFQQQRSPPASPTLRSPSIAETANSGFPLNDIDYESNPAAVAQEISNLQALRRMSMDVTSVADPDLPSFSNFVPSTPPEDGGDPGALLWVPARYHPELAPQEFSKYIEAKKNEIRRSPSSAGSLSPIGNEGPGLRRKKSMLSRQVDNPELFQDGAERLQRTASGRSARTVQLDDLMNDPDSLLKKLNADREGDPKEDRPIIQPPKVGLRRSTATHYRKGGSLRRERVGSLKRQQHTKASETDPEDNGSPEEPVPQIPMGHRLARVATEPLSMPSRKPEKKTPKPRPPREQLPPGPPTSFEELVPKSAIEHDDSNADSKHKSAPPRTKRSSSPGPKVAGRNRTSEPAPPVPRIVETPPPPSPILEIPERASSHESSGTPDRPGSVKKRPSLARAQDAMPDVSSIKGSQESLQPDKKEKKRLTSDSASTALSTSKDRKTSWSWLSGSYSAEREREKEERKEREREEKLKAKRDKRPKSQEKHDNTRLDILQQSIDQTGSNDSASASTAGSDRKSRSEDKKEKDSSGIFSFLRKKSTGHSGSSSSNLDPSSSQQPTARDRKSTQASRSRETSPHPVKNVETMGWTRFELNIERAIYRLSHLKLANPRRPLHQQVLLSNFMYSYLAKVQQTRPGLVQQAGGSRQQQLQQQQQQQQYQQQQAQQQQQEQERQRQQQLEMQRQQQQQYNQQQYYQSRDSSRSDDPNDNQQYYYEDSSHSSHHHAEIQNLHYYDDDETTSSSSSSGELQPAPVQSRQQQRRHERADVNGGSSHHGRERERGREDMW